jgi:hypothetical protein
MPLCNSCVQQQLSSVGAYVAFFAPFIATKNRRWYRMPPARFDFDPSAVLD